MRQLYLTLLLALSVTGAQAQIDSTTGAKAPRKATRNYKKLTHYLCDPLDSEKAKANAIYNWITHNIRYDVKALQRGSLKTDKPATVLRKRKTLCGGYAELYAAMCREAGLAAMVIDGYAKDWMFDNGDKFYIPRHAWNAVRTEYGWQLVDATWGAGGLSQSPGWLRRKLSKAAKDPVRATGKLKFRFRYGAEWFMPAPEQFRLKHLPTDPVWQLTDTLMPIVVFEAGDTAIREFNERYSRPQQSNPDLDRLCDMKDHKQRLTSADRSYLYNPRFPVVMASKCQAGALDSIVSLSSDASEEERSSTLAAVKTGLKTGDQYLAQQKKLIVAEYNDLRKKNKTKNLEAKKHIRDIRTDNKRLIAQCRSHIRQADNRHRFALLKAGTEDKAYQRSVPEKQSGAAPAARTAATRMTILGDSIRNRSVRIAALNKEILSETQYIEQLKNDNSNVLDTLAGFLVIADSALVRETIGRLNMHDSYDDEVTRWISLFRMTRFGSANALQKKYLGAFDSAVVHYENRRKLQWQQLELYRKNLKDIAQYKRLNGGTARGVADGVQQDYAGAHDAHIKGLQTYAAYVKGNKGLFERLVSLYEHQEKLTGYMERSEEKRRELEEKNLEEKQAFDKRENEQQKRQLEQTSKKAERFLTRKA